MPASAGADTPPPRPEPHHRSAWSVPEAGLWGPQLPAALLGLWVPAWRLGPAWMSSCTLSSELPASGSAPPAASDTRPLRPDCFYSHRLCSVSQISPREPWEAFGFLLSSSRLTGTSFDLTVENEACSDSVWSVSALLAFLRPSGV